MCYDRKLNFHHEPAPHEVILEVSGARQDETLHEIIIWTGRGGDFEVWRKGSIETNRLSTHSCGCAGDLKSLNDLFGIFLQFFPHSGLLRQNASPASVIVCHIAQSLPMQALIVEIIYCPSHFRFKKFDFFFEVIFDCLGMQPLNPKNFSVTIRILSLSLKTDENPHSDIQSFASASSGTLMVQNQGRVLFLWPNSEGSIKAIWEVRSSSFNSLLVLTRSSPAPSEIIVDLHFL